MLGRAPVGSKATLARLSSSLSVWVPLGTKLMSFVPSGLLIAPNT